MWLRLLHCTNSPQYWGSTRKKRNVELQCHEHSQKVMKLLMVAGCKCSGQAAHNTAKSACKPSTLKQCKIIVGTVGTTHPQEPRSNWHSNNSTRKKRDCRPAAPTTGGSTRRWHEYPRPQLSPDIPACARFTKSPRVLPAHASKSWYPGTIITVIDATVIREEDEYLELPCEYGWDLAQTHLSLGEARRTRETKNYRVRKNRSDARRRGHLEAPCERQTSQWHTQSPQSSTPL